MTLWSIYFVPLFSSPLKWNSCNPVQQGSLQIPNKIKNVERKSIVHAENLSLLRRRGKRGWRIMGLRERITWHYSRRLRAHAKNKTTHTKDKNASSFYAFLSGIRRIPNYKIMRRQF
jgi:hypothetical protein